MKVTRREFSKIVGATAFSAAGASTLLGADGVKGNSNAITAPVEWAGGRRVGIRKTGTYWGGSCEQLDMLSGNLNFTLPLALSASRGAIAKIAISYNSQLWERNGADERNYGTDMGSGYGWSVRIGAIVPKYTGKNVTGYTYVTESGAEYPLTQSQKIRGRMKI